MVSGRAALYVIRTLLLAQPLTGEGLFNPPLFAGLQIERVLLDVLDNIFLLNFSLESLQGTFQRFTFSDDYFCQTLHLQSFRKLRAYSLLGVPQKVNNGNWTVSGPIGLSSTCVDLTIQGTFAVFADSHADIFTIGDAAGITTARAFIAFVIALAARVYSIPPRPLNDKNLKVRKVWVRKRSAADDFIAGRLNGYQGWTTLDINPRNVNFRLEQAARVLRIIGQ